MSVKLHVYKNNEWEYSPLSLHTAYLIVRLKVYNISFIAIDFQF